MKRSQSKADINTKSSSNNRPSKKIKVEETGKVRWCKELEAINPGIKVAHCPKFYETNGKESKKIFEQLSAIPLVRDKLKIMGREVETPRKVGFFGDPGSGYTFSGTRHDAKPVPSTPVESEVAPPVYWPPFLQSIKEKVEEYCTDHVIPSLKEQGLYDGDEVKFNYVLINRYEDGNDNIGWHSDSENDLKKNGMIVSLSFGAQRDFAFKQIIPKSQRSKSTPNKTLVKLALSDGDLCIMAGETQKHTQHSIPKRKCCKQVRFNLTFRQMK